MRRMFSLFLALTLFLSLTACAPDTPDSEPAGSLSATISSDPSGSNETIHSHLWKDASCTSPKTCSTCGATEGQAFAHSWKDATCTSPKKCMLCGTADGNSLDHSWMDANCTTPKTCSACGETTGSVSAHNYSNGKCAACGKADPSDPNNIMVWIPINGGTKYHSRSGCSNMKNPKYVTLSAARTSGYTACQRCH